MGDVLTAETILSAVRQMDEAGYRPPFWYTHPSDEEGR